MTVGSWKCRACRAPDDDCVSGLLFERFLNEERKSLPDIDSDFCPLGRDRVRGMGWRDRDRVRASH